MFGICNTFSYHSDEWKERNVVLFNCIWYLDCTVISAMKMPE